MLQESLFSLKMEVAVFSKMWVAIYQIIALTTNYILLSPKYFSQRNFLATGIWRFNPQFGIPIKHRGKGYTPFIISLHKTGNESITQHWGASCNHCYYGKAISITYSDCVFAALGIHHAMRMRHIVVCGLLSCTIHAIIFEKKKVIENEMCVLIFSTPFVWNISHSKKKLARYDQKCIFVSTSSAVMLVRF